MRTSPSSSRRRMQSFFKTQGAETFVTTPEEFYRLLVSDIANLARVVKASGARLD